MNLPEHISLRITHNPHAGDYRTLEQWLDDQLVTAEEQGYKRDEVIRPEDLAAIRSSGEVWVINWCPRTPVGSCEVIAATLERALDLANEVTEAPYEPAGGRTSCWACNGSGCDRCIPSEFSDAE